MHHQFWKSGSVGLMLAAASDAALAYVGPGAGLGALGTIIALIGAVLLAVVGFVWYPIKRLMRGRDKKKADGPNHH